MKKAPLINKDFSIVWFGQLVSSLGDAVHEIALGFWVLAMTGSTALMGSLMASAALPRIILGPFAGVVSDRCNRKWIIVLMDLVRGALVLIVGILAYFDQLQVWMLFCAGIIVGSCSAFFSPAVMSAVPDLVTKEQLMPANSLFSMIRSISGILGNSAGGFIFQLLGAPLLFIIDGISYLFSGISEMFISIPKIVREKPLRFMDDLKEGASYVWSNSGLKLAFLGFAFLNFFATAGFILYLPLYQKYEFLGAGRYGITMGALTLGSLVGLLINSKLKLSPKQRLYLYGIVSVGMGVAMVIFPLFIIFPVMLVTVFISGIFNSILNVIINTILQLSTPPQHRGKVFGLLFTLSGALAPLGMATGGIGAEFIGIREFIFLSFLVILLMMIGLLFLKSFRDFIMFDETDLTPDG